MYAEILWTYSIRSFCHDDYCTYKTMQWLPSASNDIAVMRVIIDCAVYKPKLVYCTTSTYY